MRAPPQSQLAAIVPISAERLRGPCAVTASSVAPGSERQWAACSLQTPSRTEFEPPALPLAFATGAPAIGRGHHAPRPASASGGIGRTLPTPLSRLGQGRDRTAFRIAVTCASSPQGEPTTEAGWGVSQIGEPGHLCPPPPHLDSYILISRISLLWEKLPSNTGFLLKIEVFLKRVTSERRSS